MTSEPPVRFAFAEEGWLDGAPPLLTEIAVEDLGDRRSRVSLANRIDGDATPEAQRALATAGAAWRPYLAALQLHLDHHACETPHTVDVSGAASGSPDEAWGRALDALGWRDAAPGTRVSVPGDPSAAGRVEQAGEREIVLRLDAPAPGYALVAAFEGARGPLINVHAWLHGADAEEHAAREGAAWETWMRERLPRDGDEDEAVPAQAKRLPPRLSEHPLPVRVLLAIVLPIAFGAITGVALGWSEIAYLILSVLGILGGLGAGFDHRGARAGALRGLLGGTLFGGAILVAHELSGAEAEAHLPEPAVVLVAITAILGVLLGALGGRLRARAESRA